MAPKKLTDAQVLDLGTHVIKAAAVSTKSGKLTVERAASIVLKESYSEPTRYFNDVRAAVEAFVNSGTLDRKTPLYFVVGENLMPISIAYLNNQEPAGLDIALEDSLNKFVASEGTSGLEVILKKSFKLREKPQAAQVQVVAGHAYIKYDLLKELQEICASRKIPFGGAYPKIFAYQELFRHAFAADTQVLNSIAVLVDIGYNSTNLVAFKEGRIVFHKSLHMGGRDFFNELRQLSAEKNFFQLTFPQFTDYMAKVGMDASPDRVAALGLPITNPAAYTEITDQVCEELATKIRLSLDYFSTVSATDFNTSMATVMAVRKGAEYIYMTGGLLATEGFVDKAHQQLTDDVQILDALSTVNSKVEATPSPYHFAVAVGGGLIALGDETDTYNMGLMLEGTGSGASAAASSGSALENVPQWAHLILIAVLLAVGYEWYEANSACKKLAKQRGEALNALSEAKDIVPKYIEAKRELASNMARLDLLHEILKGRPSWSSLFKEINESSQGLVRVNRLQAQTIYPRFDGARSADGTMVGKPEPLKVRFKISGEAKNRDNVFAFSRKLTEKGHFTDLEQPQLVEAAGGSNPFAGEPVTLELDANFFFELSGTIKGK